MTQRQPAPHDEIAGIGGRCYAYQARKTANAVLRAYNDWMKPIDLEMAQFSTMCAILDGSAVSIGKLADLLGVERSTLVRNLKVLEKKGLVRVAARTQRRLTHELTDQGVAMMRRALPLWQQAQGAMEAAIGGAKERDVHGALRDLRQALPVAFAEEESA
jgi:DNA-binding MarR family transcriptional regulator